jgi:hypothetical protein
VLNVFEKEKKMADKKILFRILVMALISGITVVGCATPKNIEDAKKDIKENTDNKHKEVVKKTSDIQTENTNNFSEVNRKLDELLKQSELPTYPENSRIVPVSMEIIERTKAEKININKLDYYLSANITVFINDTNDRFELQDGKLIETKTNLSEEIPITIGKAGKLVSSGDNFFGISFTEENIVLRFERNMVRNRFDLVSASKRGKNYSLNFENEKPYLVINYPYIPNEKNIQVQGVGASVSVRNDISPPVGTEKIEGRGTLTQAVVVQFILERNRNYSRSFLEEFIGAYFSEAGKLEINPDIAIAQMCHITNFLKNEKLMSTHNYAGFNTMPAGGRFRNREEGILAHIQHLKGYADGKYRPGHIVDPRWDFISSFRGTVDNLDGLAKIWSPNNKYYTAEISKIINDMRCFAPGRWGV